MPKNRATLKELSSILGFSISTISKALNGSNEISTITKKRVKEIIAFVIEQGGLDYAQIQMNQFRDKALEILKAYPETVYSIALSNLVNYVVDRKI